MSSTRLAIAASALLVVVAAGAAYAAIPATNGAITSCVQRNGYLRLIDAEDGETCQARETEVSWSQQGPQGPQGPQGTQGTQGAQGPAGVSGRVVVEGAANSSGAALAQCPPGKVALGGGCNGTAGASASFNGPSDSLGGVHGWLVIAPAGSTLTAYAICATAG